MHYEQPSVKLDTAEAETVGFHEFHILDAPEVLRIIAEQAEKCQQQVADANLRQFGVSERPDGKAAYFSPRGVRLMNIAGDLEILLSHVTEGEQE